MIKLAIFLRRIANKLSPAPIVRTNPQLSIALSGDWGYIDFVLYNDNHGPTWSTFYERERAIRAIENAELFLSELKKKDSDMLKVYENYQRSPND